MLEPLGAAALAPHPSTAGKDAIGTDGGSFSGWTLRTRRPVRSQSVSVLERRDAQRFHPIDDECLRPIQLQLVGRESAPKSQVVDAKVAQVLVHPACAESSSQLRDVTEQLFSAHGLQSERQFRLRQGQVRMRQRRQARGREQSRSWVTRAAPLIASPPIGGRNKSNFDSNLPLM